MSLILGPDGRMIGAARREEGLLVATVDLAACVEPKQFHDVAGYYQRPDVFRFEVDRSPRDVARFSATGERRPVPALAADEASVLR